MERTTDKNGTSAGGAAGAFAGRKAVADTATVIGHGSSERHHAGEGARATISGRPS